MSDAYSEESFALGMPWVGLALERGQSFRRVLQRLVAALSRKRYFFKILEPARDREFGEDVSNMSEQALFGSTLAKLLFEEILNDLGAGHNCFCF